MRKAFLLALVVLGLAPGARAETVVLRSGQRLRVTGYERAGEVLRLQVQGGAVEVAAQDVLAIEPEDSYPAPQGPALNVPYSDVIRQAAQRHGVDQDLIAAVIAAESNFDPRAVSRKFARGLMQLLPETASRFAVANIFDPAQNVDAGTRYLKELLDRYHQDLPRALAAYNAGPDRVERYRGVPPYSETRSYVRRVTQNLKQRKEHTHRRPAAASAR